MKIPYIQPEIVEKAKKIDLLTYLQNYEPDELVHVSGNVYSTRTHDSLRISNGLWCWFSRGIGGKSALDYLIKVNGLEFTQAVEKIMGYSAISMPVPVKSEEKKPKKLLLPDKSKSDEKVRQYLIGRGIDEEIIEFCIRTGRIYESKPYHNAVFVGMDKNGKPKYASLRGIGTDFLGDANGSDKHYSFSIPSETSSDTVHLFESPIDAMSYATMIKMCGRSYRKHHLLSLAGVYAPKKNIQESKPPAALVCYFEMYPEIRNILLHLDNDTAGRLAAKTIKAVIPEKYIVKDSPPTKGKDGNDYLCIIKNIPVTSRSKERRTKNGPGR